VTLKKLYFIILNLTQKSIILYPESLAIDYY
jgi:hypothetical protein